MTFYEPRLPCDATQIGRFRAALGEAGVEELLKATIDTAVASKVIKPAEFERVIVDTTVQEKAIAHPVDSRLLEIARHKIVAAARHAGIALKQTFVKEGRNLRRRAGGYAHAKQFKRLQKVDLGFRGVDATNPDIQIIHQGRFKSLTDQQRRWLKRRQAVEPAMGHLKHDNGMDRCRLKGSTGDAVLCAAGDNLRWLCARSCAWGSRAFVCACLGCWQCSQWRSDQHRAPRCMCCEPNQHRRMNFAGTTK